MSVGTPSTPLTNPTAHAPGSTSSTPTTATPAVNAIPSTQNRDSSAKENLSPEDEAALAKKKQDQILAQQKADEIAKKREFGGDDEEAAMLGLGLGGGATLENYAQSHGGAKNQKSRQQLLREQKLREEQLKKEAQAKLKAQQSNDPSAGKITAKMLEEEEHAKKMDELRRLTKEGNVFQRVASRVRLVTEPIRHGAQKAVAKVVDVVVSPFRKAAKAITEPVANLFKSGEESAKTLKGAAEGAKLGEDGVKIAKIGEDVVKGEKLLKVVKGIKLLSRGTALLGLGGAGFTFGLSAVASTAIDATLGVVAGGLTYMATRDVKAATMEGLDTASPVPVKGVISLVKGNYRQAAIDTVGWTGLSIFGPVNNFVHRLAQGKQIVDHRKGIEETAKVVGTGVKEIATHPIQDAKALNYAAHHLGETAKVVVVGAAAVGGTVLTVAAAKKAEHDGFVNHAAYTNVATKGFDAIKGKTNEAATQHHDHLEADKAKVEAAVVHNGVVEKMVDRVKRTGMKSMVPDTLPAPKVAENKIKDEISDRKLNAAPTPVDF